MSTLLNEPLRLWLTQLDFSTVEPDPYLFHPTTDASRCLTSSQWCATVKAAFLKHSGKSPPPKLLRASFVTWVRDEEAAPEVLKVRSCSIGFIAIASCWY
jgi:hypothetical protein